MINKITIPEGVKYSCPNCGKIHNDFDETYTVNNETYPKRYNHRKGYTLDGEYHDWDELHCCEECETKYWFENGAY